ncbi:hypothetical protein INT43_000244 [Umbelopsis isabellina]|uniref:DNA replication regulator SLD2 n=1 Tax=Mortierella isabellina TaxID=91625 RepID=A0A8H7PFV4_MORIS|nr:hypothetical protein INT43_000244 [Umbelopsis isabellina]
MIFFCDGSWPELKARSKARIGSLQFPQYHTQQEMTGLDKQCKVLKRKLKEWEAAFLKENGRKATVEDIAQNPELESEYKQYKVLKKKHLEESNLNKKQANTDKSSRHKHATPQDNNSASRNTQLPLTLSQNEEPGTPSTAKGLSFEFESPRIKRRSDSTPTRRRSFKVDAFVSSVEASTRRHTSVHKSGSQPPQSPLNRQHTVDESPSDKAKRLLRTPTKLSSALFTSPRPIKSLESVFQEGENNRKQPLLDLFVNTTKNPTTGESDSPIVRPPLSRGDESVDFFLEGMVDVKAQPDNSTEPVITQAVPRRREKQPGMEGFAPSNSLDDKAHMTDQETQQDYNLEKSPTRINISQPNLLSPLNFQIARPPLPTTKSSPGPGQSQFVKNIIMPGYYSSLAAGQDKRRLLMSPERRQRLLRQLSDGGIGNTLIDDADDTLEELANEQLITLKQSQDTPAQEEVYKKKPIQKRQTRLHKIPFVDMSEVRLNDKPNRLSAKRSVDDLQSESEDQVEGDEAMNESTSMEPTQRRSTRKKKGLNTGQCSLRCSSNPHSSNN